MLTRVDVVGYRGFRQFQVSDLSTVNLFVGRNNCGKTALLECVHFLASGGDPYVLLNAATRRGELVAEDQRNLDLSHFFHQHEIRPGSTFEVSCDAGSQSIVVSTVSVEEFEAPEGLLPAESRSFELVLRIQRAGTATAAQRPLYLSDRGALLNDPRRSPRRFPADDRREGPPVVFISPESLATGSLGGMWRQILRDKQELFVRQSMRILEPTLEDIVFEPGEPGVRPGTDRAGILISLEGDSRRFPLGTMGDGMRRLLSLAVALTHVRGGLLLVDEIDTGFHYSIMAQMWELVVRTAAEANIQVFATTHSWDCIEGLSQFCQRHADLSRHVAIHKIDRAIPRSVGFSGDAVARMIKAHIDPR